MKSINKPKVFKGDLFISLAIVMIYCLCRFFIYELVPVSDFESWVRRDNWVNIPRILCLLLSLVFVLRKKSQELLPNLVGARKIAIVWVFVLLSFIIRFFFLDIASDPIDSLLLAFLSSFVVGFFEEALFRGAIFDTLNSEYGVKKALFWSSVIFTIYHVQAQPISAMPLIFVFSLLFGLLRADGVSLFLLSVLHAVYDCFVLVWGPGEGVWIQWSIFEVIFFASAVFLYIWFARVRGRERVVFSK